MCLLLCSVPLPADLLIGRYFKSDPVLATLRSSHMASVADTRQHVLRIRIRTCSVITAAAVAFETQAKRKGTKLKHAPP